MEALQVARRRGAGRDGVAAASGRGIHGDGRNLRGAAQISSGRSFAGRRRHRGSHSGGGGKGSGREGAGPEASRPVAAQVDPDPGTPHWPPPPPLPPPPPPHQRPRRCFHPRVGPGGGPGRAGPRRSRPVPGAPGRRDSERGDLGRLRLRLRRLPASPSRRRHKGVRSGASERSAFREAAGGVTRVGHGGGHGGWSCQARSRRLLRRARRERLGWGGGSPRLAVAVLAPLGADALTAPPPVTSPLVPGSRLRRVGPALFRLTAPPSWPGAGTALSDWQPPLLTLPSQIYKAVLSGSSLRWRQNRTQHRAPSS